MNKQREHRRIWNSEQDNILRTFVEESMTEGKPKWKQISQKLNQVLKLEFKRNPKQCRQRWYNSLAATQKETNVWTLQDDVTLIQACKKYGHRWSRLTKEFSKCINDNKLKNHFYSTVRKIVRVINTIIKQAKKQYQTDTKNQMVSHYEQYDHFVLKEISKLRTFQPKLLSKVFSLIDSKQQYKYEAKQNLQVESVKTINDEILDYMEDFVTEKNQFTKKRVLQMIVKVMQVNRTIKTKYTREIKLSLQDDEQIQKAHQMKKKRDRKINNIVKQELDNKIIPDKKTKAQVIKKIGEDNKVLKRLIKPINNRRIVRKRVKDGIIAVSVSRGKGKIGGEFDQPKKTCESENEKIIEEENVEEKKSQNKAAAAGKSEQNFFQPVQIPLSFQFNYPPQQLNPQPPNQSILQSSLNLSQNGASHHSTPSSAHFESIFGYSHNHNNNVSHNNHQNTINNKHFNDSQHSGFIFNQIPFSFQAEDKQKSGQDGFGELRSDGVNENASIRSVSVIGGKQKQIKDEQMDVSLNRPQFINTKLQDSSKLEQQQFGNVFALNINQPNCQPDNPFNSNFLNQIPLFLSSNNQNPQLNIQPPIFNKQINPFFPQHKLTHSQGYFSFEQPIFPIEKTKIEGQIGLCRSNPAMFVIQNERQRRDIRERQGSSYAYSNSAQFDGGPNSKFQGLFASYDYQRSQKPSDQSPRSRNHIFQLMPTINPFGGAFCPVFQQNFIETSRPYSSSNQQVHVGRIDMMESVPIGMVMGYGGGTEGQVAMGEGMWRSCSFGGEEGSQRSRSKSGKKSGKRSRRSGEAREWSKIE